MAELTPEERQKIYLEEKARWEVRREFEGPKINIGKVVMYVFFGGLALLVVLLILGSEMEQSHETAWNNLTTEQRHAKTLENCATFIKSMEFKTYSELSVEERKMKAACTEQLLNPDKEIIKPAR